MTTRQQRPRTQRKEKLWATQTVGQTPADLAPNSVEVVIDILSFAKLDLGISRMRKATVMRIVGSLYLGNGTSQVLSTNAAWHWGIAWVPSQIAQAAVGDSQIPDPLEQGLREWPWIQRGVLRGNASAGNESMFANLSQMGSFVHLDIRQMRTQQAADWELVLIGHSTDSDASSDPKVWLDFNVMLALS